MTKEKVAPKLEEVKALFAGNTDALRDLLQKMVQDILESEMENFPKSALKISGERRFMASASVDFATAVMPRW